jgi:NAD(P)H-hydrate epimerase
MGLTGAAILCARGALRAGAGLVTVFCPAEAYPVIAARAPAEAMVRPWGTWRDVAEGTFHALALGPGLGRHAPEIRPLVLGDPRPAVVDADSLNDLALHGGLAALESAPGPRLLTPHPGELARLWPDGSATRLETNRALVARHRLALLHKGSRTLISAPDRPDAYNATGHPGMATGGIGDVLTGVCAALLARGTAPYEAACLGSWLVGHAAEWAVRSGRAPDGLLAGDVADHLPEAMNNLRLGVY